MLLQEDMKVASQYHAHGTPMGYLIDEQIPRHLCTDWLVKMMDPNVVSIDLTRPWKDGGRDGLGNKTAFRVSLTVSIARLLQRDDYYISPREAYWLGLVDEVIGSGLPT